MVRIGESCSRIGRVGANGKRWSAALASVLGCLFWSCGTNNTYYQQYIVTEADAGAGDRDEPANAGAAGAAGASSERPPLGVGSGVASLSEDAGAPLRASGAPDPDTQASELALDVFGAVGNHYYFEASPEQVERMNERYTSFGAINDDLYTPSGAGSVTFVDHLFVTAAGEPAHTADFGKVQVKLVGESTGRPWTEGTLPNFKLDADELVDDNSIGGVKHMRLNNAVVGNIYRERLAFDIYRALGYPAPRVTYAWVSGSVWGPQTDVPYIAVESYKPQFCKLREAQLGGGCVNMWEFYGDFGMDVFGYPDSCQFSDCDPTRALELDEAVLAAPLGDGFKAALEDWFDWDSVHRMQCMSWIIETPDDYFHALNNVVVAERKDGKFQFLPYSVDFSFDHEWGPRAELPGSSLLALGCQSDPVCWADTIATCEQLIGAYAAADPPAMLDDIHAELAQAGMLRDGDESRYESLRKGLERRLVELPAELELNRDAPYFAYCQYPLEECGDSCVLFDECPLCEQAAPGLIVPERSPEPPVDVGVDVPVEVSADAGAGEVPLPEEPGGACRPALDPYPIRPIPF